MLTLGRHRPHRLVLAFGIAGLLVLMAGAVLSSTLADPIQIATVCPQSGEQKHFGEDMLNSVRLYVDEVNRAGGVDGHRIEVLVFDDEGDDVQARQRAEQIAKSRALIVLGHCRSGNAIAASPYYQAAHLPAITGNVGSDRLTVDNPYYFRTVFNNSAAASSTAHYSRLVLDHQQASIIFTDDELGQTLRAAFEETFKDDGGVIKHVWMYDTRPAQRESSRRAIVDALANDPETGVVYLALIDTQAVDLIVDIKRQKPNISFIGSHSLGSESFAKFFDAYPEEQRQPGYFTDGLYAASPLVYDSTSTGTRHFLEQYQQQYGRVPTWRAPKYYEAAIVAIHAIDAANVQNTAASLEDDRRRIEEQLTALVDQPAAALNGLAGALYFDRQRNSVQPVRIGWFSKQQFISAPLQLAPISNLASIDLDVERPAGYLLLVGDHYAWRQQIVYTGIDINQISRLDQGQGTFGVDFYLWFRYAGEPDVADVVFPDAVEQDFDWNAPLVVKTVAGLSYRLYRVRGEFKTVFDFHDYPFDEQFLSLRIQHKRLTREQVVYVIDTLGLRLPREAEADAPAFRALESWAFRGMRYSQDTLSSHSTRGDPAALEYNTQVEFSNFTVVATLQRRTSVFLIKTLLPLALLVLLVYISLHFSPDKHRDRVAVPVTALLAGVVMLTSIGNQLGEIGYTTAIEYGFYMFFGLCLFCLLVALHSERLALNKQHAASTRLGVWSRVIYVLVVVATVAVYAVQFGQRFS
ncbi:MAG TPA: ABC transporter substrate-binding protein [Roseiflexaceae bacterium]|nr:ABC transporter substrate-binding protein [Roseiflexaceae bacterium]